MIDENNKIIFDPSLYLRCRYWGIVIALYFCVSNLSFSAIKNQERIIPIMIPATVHNSTSPITITAPGSANNNHADSPDALSEKAVIQGPKFLPAKK